MPESYEWGTKAFDAKPLTKKQERGQQAAAAKQLQRDLDEIFDGDYEVCYAHFSPLPCPICAIEEA